MTRAIHTTSHTDTRTAAGYATTRATRADATVTRASGTLGARLWHLRLARSPLHANTLARSLSRQLRQQRVQPRLAAELVSRSILKTPATTAPFPVPAPTPAPASRDNRHEAATRHAA